jgi:DNA-binding LytR/AlgR family response regulator
MKILIIEDEPLVARDLMALVAKLEPGAEVAGPLSSARASREWWTHHEAPDLILSDIQLSDGISFDIFEDLSVKTPIIFTTAYNAYAIRAFKLNSIDYLLKPVDEAELSAALKKFKLMSYESTLGERVKTVLDQWGSGQKKYKERFLVLHRNTLVPVKADDIAFFHKDELIYLHTLANEKLISEQSTLDEIESLVNPEEFFRVNRQYLIHVHTVGKVSTTAKGLSVQLKAPFLLELDISREKASAFRRWLEN